jgi:hypothetical protein
MVVYDSSSGPSDAHAQLLGIASHAARMRDGGQRTTGIITRISGQLRRL